MPQKVIHRRDLLKGAVATGATLALESVSRAQAPNANSHLNIAIIGPGGQGKANLNAVAKDKDVQIVAICDVDDERAGDAYTRFPQAKKYYDFRQMFDEMEKQIDAVVISTPDHTHFHPAYRALSMGKHVYLEKPMAHSVWEVRQLTDLAAKKGVATQLGVQRHTLPAIHRAVELIQAGAIGNILEVHSWITGNRGMPPAPADAPIPSTLKWDLWLGPAEERSYSPDFVPYKWRFWWDFGTGETGNWGCHILDIPYWALGLKYPVRVDAGGAGKPDPKTTPTGMHVTYIFPKEGNRNAFRLHWYHGTPAILKDRGIADARGMNNLFIGSEGMLLCGFERWKLLPEADFKDYKAPTPTIPNSPGFHKEWLDACRGGKPATCHFGYSGPMTETVLLGNVAYRAGWGETEPHGGFDWDAKSLKFSGNDKAVAYLKSPFRKGWEV
jgi:predicted dehydrogenase